MIQFARHASNMLLVRGGKVGNKLKWLGSNMGGGEHQAPFYSFLV